MHTTGTPRLDAPSCPSVDPQRTPVGGQDLAISGDIFEDLRLHHSPLGYQCAQPAFIGVVSHGVLERE